jgi:hypothetical protein
VVVAVVWTLVTSVVVVVFDVVPVPALPVAAARIEETL